MLSRILNMHMFSMAYWWWIPWPFAFTRILRSTETIVTCSCMDCLRIRELHCGCDSANWSVRRPRNSGDSTAEPAMTGDKRRRRDGVGGKRERRNGERCTPAENNDCQDIFWLPAGTARARRDVFVRYSSRLRKLIIIRRHGRARTTNHDVTVSCRWKIWVRDANEQNCRPVRDTAAVMYFGHVGRMNQER